jgi:hypothetical protein
MPRSIAALALLLLACDGGSSSSEPVGISSSNLKGYWAEVGTNSPWSTPMHLHFGTKTFEGEVPPGLPTVELNGLVVAGYTLDGDFILGKDAAGVRRFSGHVVSLTGDTLVLHYGAHEHTFKRVEGCVGPDVWFTTQFEHTTPTDQVPNVGSVRDANYGPDGTLHMLASQVEGYQDAYAVVPPGRCTPWVPPLGPRGQSLDVAKDGRVWVVRSRTFGELQLYEIPPEPWKRSDLGTQDWVLEEDAMVANAPPPTRVIEDEDGDPMVLWAYGGMLHTTRIKGDAFIRDALDLKSGSGLTPNTLRIKPMPDGILVRGDRSHGGVVYHTSGPQIGTWSEWKAATLPGGNGSILGGLATAFDLAADGTLYAAWVGGESGQPVLTLGRKPVDGEWETLPIGRGGASELRVQGDGSVDVVGSLWHNGGSLTWTHVPPGFAPDTWHQSYRPATDLGTTSTGGNPAAFATIAFGPRRDVFMGMPNAAPSWTRPTDGHYATRLYQEVHLTFSNPAITRVHFPTVGLECTADCTLTLPVGAVVPLQITTDDPDDVRVANTPAWPLGLEPVDGVVSWHMTIPMMTTPPTTVQTRVPLAVELTSWPTE